MALTKVTGGGISDIAAAVEGASDSNKFTDADHTKLNGVAASANNYVHPNHSGDVVSAADGAMTIQTDAVDIAMLSATGTASNTTFLRGDNAWATAGSTSASDLTSGTLPDARFPATLPAISGANLTGIETVTDSSTAPGSPSEGDLWFNTSASTVSNIRPKAMAVYNGTSWNQMSNLPPAYVTATGPDGAAGVTDGDYKYHVFTSSKTGTNAFVVSDAGGDDGSNTIEYLIIAGGGGGGGQAVSGAYYGAGGGGAGGYLSGNMNCPAAGNHNVTIGAGGAGGTNTSSQSQNARGTQGSSSTFNGVTSTGGGFGGDGNANSTNPGGNGGSGGGGGAFSSGASLVGGSGTSGQGNDGGDAATYAGGGGGGKGAAGGNARSGGVGGYSNGGHGGSGTASSITGSSVTRAGGGGGGAYTGSGGGTGGNGGSGGAGGGGNNQAFGTAGTVNTGSGSGGAGRDSGSGTTPGGGSGVVIIRYKFQN